MRSTVVQVVLLAAALTSGTAAARMVSAAPDAPVVLGEAYRAYDANDLAHAAAALARLDDSALVNRDYALWLRGMVALRAGDPDAAAKQFKKLAKLYRNPQTP